VNRFSTLARTAQPLTLRSDNGLAFTSRRFKVTVRSYGIKQEFITPHTPQQNGMIERLFRTMKEQCIWLNNFKAFDREALQAHLTRVGIGTMIHYPIPPHMQVAFEGLEIATDALPLARDMAAEVLSLPIGPQLGMEQVTQVITQLNNFK
jgi:transposase InsO family protein